MISQYWILAFLLTVFVEMMVASIWASRVKAKPPILELVILNLITHPAAVVLSTTSAPFVLIETLVIVVEALGYMVAARLTMKQAFILSVCANGVSLLFSFI